MAQKRMRRDVWLMRSIQRVCSGVEYYIPQSFSSGLGRGAVALPTQSYNLALLPRRGPPEGHTSPVITEGLTEVLSSR